MLIEKQPTRVVPSKWASPLQRNEPRFENFS